MSSFFTLFFRTACVLTVIYVLFLVAGCSLERSLVFQPTKLPEDGEGRRSLAGYFPRGPMKHQEVEFRSADGKKLHGVLVLSGDTADENTIPVLFCHGNGGWLGNHLAWVFFDQEPGPAKYAFFAFDYRAYGYSEGEKRELSENHLYADARAARKWLAEYVKKPETEVVLMGHSLGGAVAVDLAQDGTPKLILLSTFDTMPRVASGHVPIYPASMVMQNRFNSEKKIRGVHAPLLEMHGTLDEVVPISRGEKLFEAANEPKIFVRMEDAYHNDVVGGEVDEKIREFLDGFTRK